MKATSRFLSMARGSCFEEATPTRFVRIKLSPKQVGEKGSAPCRVPVGVPGSPGLHLLVEEGVILRCQGARRRPQVEATDALVITVDSLLPVRACCHAGKSGAFGRFYLLLDLNQ
uniref:Sdh3 gene product, mitochondrial n=1 Tax=Tanacetum cinerariifolium TaxID=118510 RepID=A0A699QBQ7_TANCI|nr:sdh3 gene product, mitochondrial [Tanacetum cinerariifolium]